MKTVFLLFVMWLPGVTTADPGLEYLRSSYDKTVADKQLCRSLISQLSHGKRDNVQLAYLGALQTIWANHTANPVTKLSSFNKGKNNIEKAVKAEPFNVEIIILRLSVQKNCPGFLGYNRNIKEDTAFLTGRINSISSPVLRNRAMLLVNNSTT